MTEQRVRVKSAHRGVYSYGTRAGLRWGAVVELGRDWRTGKRRQEREEGLPSQKAALAWQTRRRAEVLGGEAVVTSKQPLGDYLRGWLDRKAAELRGTTRSNYRVAIQLLAPLHAVPLNRLGPAMLEESYHRLVGEGYLPATVRGAHRILAAALNDAVRLGLLPASPAARARPPAGGSPPRATIGLAALRTLLAATADDDRWGPVWALLAETWLRAGEVCELRWGDVDLDAGVVTVARTRTRDVAGAFVAGPPKTAAGRRAIPISPALVARLRRHRARQRLAVLASGSARAGEDAVVFPSPTGLPMQGSRLNVALRAACRAAGIPEVSVHELRHSGASIAHAAGADVKVLSERLGHSSVAITMGIYVHKTPTDHRRLSDAFARILETEPDAEASA